MANANADSPSRSEVVRLIDVRKTFDSVEVLKRVSISFPRGRTTVVLGPSGCGKSVMLKHVIGLLRPDSGAVYFEDVRIDTMEEAALGPIRRQFGFLFQQSALFDSISVEQNVAFPLVEHTRLAAAARRRRVEEVLALVRLTDCLHKMPAELSGGQRKRVALARAIVLQPKVILYDEPTTGLDPIRADVINELISQLQRDLDVTSIVVTHDLDSAFRVADDIVMLYDGHVTQRGTPAEIRASANPIVRRFLRGESIAEPVLDLQAFISTKTDHREAEVSRSTR